jgi:hypothetical protein
MESRVFIRVATQLIGEIEALVEACLPEAEAQVRGQTLQKDINAAFSGLQNPTLPTAEKLVIAAVNAGFTVNPAVQQRIHQAQSVWN